MIGKLVVYGNTRQEAIMRMAAVLRGSICLGIRTNQFLLQNIVIHNRFVEGDFDTNFVEQNLNSILERRHPVLSKYPLAEYVSIAALLHRLPSFEEKGVWRHIPFRFRNVRQAKRLPYQLCVKAQGDSTKELKVDFEDLTENKLKFKVSTNDAVEQTIDVMVLSLNAMLCASMLCIFLAYNFV